VESILSRRPGIELLPAMQGSIGFDLACQHHPDLILLDLNLPDTHGADVLQRLLAEPSTRDIPVIVLSADATARQIARLRALGIHEYLTKPIDMKQFLRVVDQTLERRPL
jgi:CheY-like chemotaxis protein